MTSGGELNLTLRYALALGYGLHTPAGLVPACTCTCPCTCTCTCTCAHLSVRSSHQSNPCGMVGYGYTLGPSPVAHQSRDLRQDSRRVASRPRASRAARIGGWNDTSIDTRAVRGRAPGGRASLTRDACGGAHPTSLPRLGATPASPIPCTLAARLEGDRELVDVIL